VEHVGWSRDVAHLHIRVLNGGVLASIFEVYAAVIPIAQLEKALDSGARVFCTLSILAVRHLERYGGLPVPFALHGCDLVVDYHLCNIREVTELRFPNV